MSIMVGMNVPVCCVKCHAMFDADKTKILPRNLIRGNECAHIKHHVDLIVPGRELGVMGC